MRLLGRCPRNLNPRSYETETLLGAEQSFDDSVLHAFFTRKPDEAMRAEAVGLALHEVMAEAFGRKIVGKRRLQRMRLPHDSFRFLTNSLGDLVWISLFELGQEQLH
jgi:hypothetical protein